MRRPKEIAPFAHSERQSHLAVGRHDYAAREYRCCRPPTCSIVRDQVAEIGNGGRRTCERNDLSYKYDKLSKSERDRRWRCHALAEFWEDPEIGDKLQNNNVTISKGMEFIKVARAQRRAEDANQEVVDEVSYGSSQDVAKSMDDESVELIFADPPWDL
jgi:hypothetical protein